MKSTKELGKSGENRAVTFLEQKGLSIISRNYRTTDGEIDIIAQDGDTIVFVEVKTRRSLSFGVPEAGVDFRKQKQIKKVAQQFISHYQLFDRNCRYDILALLYEGTAVEIKYIQNAFY
jgi:putative endonuclease